MSLMSGRVGWVRRVSSAAAGEDLQIQLTVMAPGRVQVVVDSLWRGVPVPDGRVIYSC